MKLQQIRLACHLTQALRNHMSEQQCGVNGYCRGSGSDAEMRSQALIGSLPLLVLGYMFRMQVLASRL